MWRNFRIAGEIALIGVGVLAYIVLYILPMLGRRLKLRIACVGLEGDQIEMMNRLERRLSPYHAEEVRHSLHEMFEEARRSYGLSPWRVRLLE